MSDKIKLHISTSNSKLGDIPSVNLPPIITCKPGCPCAKTCYALKGRFRFPSVKAAMAENLHLWQIDPAAYQRAVIDCAYYVRFFRWHSAGDVPSAAYLDMMTRVARACKSTQFLAFTKRDDIIPYYLHSGGAIPRNLHIVFSEWAGVESCLGDIALPRAYVRLKSGEDVDAIPSNALQCCGNCAACVRGRASCWSLRAGQSVVFDEH